MDDLSAGRSIHSTYKSRRRVVFDTAYDTLQIILVASKCSERYRRRSEKKKKKRKKRERNERERIRDRRVQRDKKEEKERKGKEERKRKRAHLKQKGSVTCRHANIRVPIKVTKPNLGQPERAPLYRWLVKIIERLSPQNFFTRSREGIRGRIRRYRRSSLPPPFASLNTVVYLVGEIEMGKERTRQKEKKKRKETS